MEYKTVIAERAKDGRVGIMTLNRPDKLNAWNTQLVDDMLSCLTEFKNDENVNVVIVKAAGKHFSAGMDFTEVLDKPTDVALTFFRKAWAVRTLMRSMPQITIASVQGAAIAFGIHLVWGCDLAVASEAATFGAPPISIGYGWMFGEPEFRFMGPKQVNDFTMLATMVPATEAKRLGIVNRVVPPDKLEEATMLMVEQLLAKNPWALARIKFANYEDQEMPVESALNLGIHQAVQWLQYDDVKEGVRAFLEKRKANLEQFKGKVKHVPT